MAGRRESRKLQITVSALFFAGSDDLNLKEESLGYSFVRSKEVFEHTTHCKLAVVVVVVWRFLSS